MRQAFRFDRLWTGERWFAPGYLTCGADGLVEAVSGAVPAAGTPLRSLGGTAIPGMPNLHGHAFQRAFAGRAERRGAADEDSFWSWREQMYRFARALEPDQFEAIGAMAAVEMLESGFTSLAEFHYLHHAADGQRYADPLEMGGRALAVGDAVGIRTTLLPVLYLRGGFGAPLRDEQARFGCRDVAEYMGLVERAGDLVRGTMHRVGIAPHSLRAVDPEGLEEAVGAWCGRGPVHVHIAEQQLEVDDCVRHLGARPVQWLLDHADAGPAWCLVHATHVDARELALMKERDVVVGLCPTTEANLGDGIFPDPAYGLDDAVGGAVGIGTDSHVSIDVAEELRLWEYGQRLRDRKRARVALPGEPVGRDLYRAALRGGARACGAPDWGLRVGAPADFVLLDTTHGRLADHGEDTLLDALVFSRAGAPPVDQVWVAGRRVVWGGQHVDRDAVRRRYLATMRRLDAAAAH